MAHPLLRLPLAAAGLVVTGAALAWLASPGSTNEVLAGGPRGADSGSVGAGSTAPATAPDALRRPPSGAGILEIEVHGLQIPMGQESHEAFTASILQLTGGTWSSEAPVVDHKVAFGEVPRDATFVLVLRDERGVERLRTDVVGPVNDQNPAPDYAMVHVSLSEEPELEQR